MIFPCLFFYRIVVDALLLAGPQLHESLMLCAIAKRAVAVYRDDRAMRTRAVRIQGRGII